MAGQSSAGRGGPEFDALEYFMASPDPVWRELERSAVREGGFKPFHLYNPDGDCIEFYLSNENYRAERIDRWLTVFISEETDEPIGGLIKGVKAGLLPKCAGAGPDRWAGKVSVVLQIAVGEAAGYPHRYLYRVLIENADRALPHELQVA